MFLPIGDTPNPRNFTAIVNYALIGINVAIYLFISMPLSGQAVDPSDPAVMAYIRMLSDNGFTMDAIRQALSQLTAYDLFVYEHGFKPGAPSISDLFASMFLHGGFLHLAGNMLFLWIYGDNVEHRLGRVGYLVVYLFTGVVATLSFAMFAGGSTTPLVGASGAISGVLGLYFLLFKRNRVKVFVFFFPFIMDVMHIPARWVLGFYLVWDNLLPVLSGAQSNVAYGAHIGGFVGGLAVAWVAEKMQWEWPWQDRVQRRRARVDVVDGGRTEGYLPDKGLDRLRHFMASGDAPNALGTLDTLYMHDVQTLTAAECGVLSGWLQRVGRGGAAARLLRQALGRAGDGSEAARLYLALAQLRLAQGQPTAAYQHLLAALDHRPEPEVEAATRELLGKFDVVRRRR